MPRTPLCVVWTTSFKFKSFSGYRTTFRASTALFNAFTLLANNDSSRRSVYSGHHFPVSHEPARVDLNASGPASQMPFRKPSIGTLLHTPAVILLTTPCVFYIIRSLLTSRNMSWSIRQLYFSIPLSLYGVHVCHLDQGFGSGKAQLLKVRGILPRSKTKQGRYRSHAIRGRLG